MNESSKIARAVRAALKSDVGELPPAPAAAIKLLQLTREEETLVADISHVIETEPALTAKVLQIVNSAYYGFTRRIRSIPRAVTLLGFSAVRQAALHVLFYEDLMQRGSRGSFDRLYFWQHCLLVAILSRSMAEHLGHPDPDAMYVAGLLHDLGKAILESHGRVRYSDFVLAVSNSGSPMLEEERIFFGVSHDTVGSVICENWELPESVCRIQQLHHRPFASAGLSPQQAQEVAIVAMADFIAWSQGIGSINSLNGPTLSQDVLSQISPDQLDLPDLLERADAEITEIGTFYGLEFPTSMQLRANMVSTAIALCRTESSRGSQHPTPAALRASHTAPHQSLDPDEFIPRTLEALQQEFGIASLLMMQIVAKRRSLVATHALSSAPGLASPRPNLELIIDSLSGDLVRCLRERRPMLIGQSHENLDVLTKLGVAEAAAIPVMNNGRLLGVLWVCSDQAGPPVPPGFLTDIARVAGELGIAIERSRTFAQERAKAEIDPLTQLHNRNALERFLNSAFQQATESDRQVAVGLLDIDRFKGFNDQFGHQAGDDVLRIVADTMRGLTRPSDFLGRYGGEEFLFVLLDSNGKGVLSYAERIRREIERRGQLLKDRFPGHALTASIGVAMYQDGCKDPWEIISAADSALYRAKDAGRNRIRAAWDLI